MDTRFSKRFKVDVDNSKSGTYIDIVDPHDDSRIYATINIGYFRGGRYAPVNIDVRYAPDYFVGTLQEERKWAWWSRPAWAPTPKPPAPSPDTRPKVQLTPLSDNTLNGVTWADLVARATKPFNPNP